MKQYRINSRIVLFIFWVLGGIISGVIFSLDKNQNYQYQGENISLNFQDIEVRAALQIIADFSGLNLVVSDTVKGNITLHLIKLPWDQALDIILKMKGLDKRKLGNVLLIGPSEEMIAREKLEMENAKQLESLGSLKSQLIQIHYAKAEDLAMILKEKANTLMTARGSVTVDRRTNTLLIQDTAEKLMELNHLLEKLDVQLRQVEIATQIITADTSLEDILGLKLGVVNKIPHKDQELFNDLGKTDLGIAKLGMAVVKLPKGTLLDLELQALELEAKIKTISRPKLMTVDQNKASVEQGFEIPYQEATKSGATSTSYKKAALKLEVTPRITPEGKITLDLIISNDSPSNISSLVGANVGASNGSSIGLKTARLQTQILVNDGETIVLGGVLTLADTNTKTKIPLLGDIPILGKVFSHQFCRKERKELLIFITPHIVKSL